MKLEETVGLVGELEMIFRNTETGEVIEHFKENNIVLSQGRNELFRAFNTLDNNDHKVKTIVIGNDVGNGTVMEPEEPNLGTKETDQNSVYEVPLSEFFIEYPSVNSTRYLATINGADVLNNYPNQPNVVYTSASIRTQAGKAVAYRRFSARTISTLISVDIIWTLTLN